MEYEEVSGIGDAALKFLAETDWVGHVGYTGSINLEIRGSEDMHILNG